MALVGEGKRSIQPHAIYHVYIYIYCDAPAGGHEAHLSVEATSIPTPSLANLSPVYTTESGLVLYVIAPKIQTGP